MSLSRCSKPPYKSPLFFTFSLSLTFFLQLMSITRTILGKRGFSLVLRPTVYAQFVAGENEKEISQSMEKMSLLGLRPMLAVPIEEDVGESTGYFSHKQKLFCALYSDAIIDKCISLCLICSNVHRSRSKCF